MTTHTSRKWPSFELVGSWLPVQTPSSGPQPECSYPRVQLLHIYGVGLPGSCSLIEKQTTKSVEHATRNSCKFPNPQTLRPTSTPPPHLYPPPPFPPSPLSVHVCLLKRSGRNHRSPVSQWPSQPRQNAPSSLLPGRCSLIFVFFDLRTSKLSRGLFCWWCRLSWVAKRGIQLEPPFWGLPP